MWRFVYRENIRHLVQLLGVETSTTERERLQKLLLEAERELADLEAASAPLDIHADDALQRVAQDAVDDAVRELGAQFGNMQLHSEASAGLVVIAQRNFRAEFLHHFSVVRLGDGSACSRCYESGQQVPIEDVDYEDGYEDHRKAAADAGYRAVVSTPLRDGTGTVIGVFSVHYAKPRIFDGFELARFSTKAERVGPLVARHLYA